MTRFKMEEAKQVVLDIESSGLDCNYNRMFEVSCIQTDLDGTIEDIFRGNTLLELTHEELDTEISKMDDYVFTMHTKNGLIDDLRKGENTTTPKQLDADLSEWLDGRKLEHAPLVGGNSVGFDRGFLEKNLPKFYSKLHYRNADATSVWALLTAANLKAPKPQLETYSHRSLDDARFSAASWNSSVNFLKELARKANLSDENQRLADLARAYGLDG